jgi:hypothetical protein
VRVLRWICGVKPKLKAVNKPLHHSIVHGLDKPGSSATVSSKPWVALRCDGWHPCRQAGQHATGRVSPWHLTRSTDAGTQTPTATPEGGRLHDALCLWSSPYWEAYTILALERRSALLPTAEPPGVRRSVTVDISVASSQERSSSASLHHCRRTSGAQARTKACPALR